MKIEYKLIGIKDGIATIRGFFNDGGFVTITIRVSDEETKKLIRDQAKDFYSERLRLYLFKNIDKIIAFA